MKDIDTPSSRQYNIYKQEGTTDSFQKLPAERPSRTLSSTVNRIIYGVRKYSI